MICGGRGLQLEEYIECCFVPGQTEITSYRQSGGKATNYAGRMSRSETQNVMEERGRVAKEESK